jgi:hypothetical protein
VIERHLTPLALKLLEWTDPLAEERDLGKHDDSGVVRYFNDFVDIPSVEWEALFDSSTTLDLFINYTRTWRNTYMKQLDALVRRDRSRLRLVLPDTSPRSRVLALQAHRHGKSVGAFRTLVEEARGDFAAFGRNVEVYETSVAFHHSAHIFERGAVISLYSLCGERIATPAFVVEEGGLFDFVRHDFALLVNGTDLSRCWRVA